MNKPLVSIIVRIFNSELTIKKCILSILNQSLDINKVEIILIDDGSTDESLKLISDYLNRAVLIKTNQIGAVNALNTALNNATGKYYFILDSDDYLPPNALELLTDEMTIHNDCAFVYGNYYEVNLESNKIKLISTKNNILTTIAGGILFILDIVKNENLYDSSLFFPEYDLLLKIIKNHKVVHLDKPVYYYVRHLGSLTANKKQTQVGLKELESKYHKKLNIRKY